MILVINILSFNQNIALFCHGLGKFNVPNMHKY